MHADGSKKPVGLEDGYRESADSWADLMRDRARHGRRASTLAVGDGRLGLAEGRDQAAQPGTKKALQEI